MKFTDFQRKSVSLIVLAAFVTLLHFWATPAPAATGAGTSETAMTQADSNGPGFVEEESSSEAFVKKEKKFPWLFVGLGVVAVGVAVYFLVIKKPQYTLTVTLGANCTGTPAATAKFKKGEVVTYNYTAAAGYSAKVLLDGAAVADAGTVTMDKDHTLAVTAAPYTPVGTWSLTEVYSNGKSYTANFTFVETVANASGTYTSTDGDHGTWTKSGLNVRIESDYYTDLVYTGAFTGKDRMAGTQVCRFDNGLLVSGTWTANRGSTTAARFNTATAQTGPAKQKKNH